MQKRYGEGYALIEESLDLAKELGNEFVENRATSQAVLGMLLVREGNYSKARECLSESLKVKLKVKDNLGISEAFVWNGSLAEATGDWAGAVDFFQKSLDWSWTGRRYYVSAALVGLCRSKYYSSKTDSLKVLIKKAEQVGLDNDYYDHLASLRQIEGNLIWDGRLKLRGKTFEQAQKLYLQALVCALRHNRFLLDDILDGIVAHCRQRGKEGQRMIRSLSQSWKSGRNDVHGSRPSSISPLPAGASLLKAESLARARELGDGVEQVSVVQTLEGSLS
jgi:tetratricopeptide (TPR) repeat protein